MFDEGKKGSLFSYEDMIKNLEEKGILFNIINKTDAKRILIERNYYYKLTAYKKNFDKNYTTGKYSNLEFAYLVDLASIDMRLRYYILEISLDVEHSIKTVLLDLITKNPNEDGYTIVDDFKKHFPKDYDDIMALLKRSRYLTEMYSKRSANVPVWVLIELMSFGSLSKFVTMYSAEYSDRRLMKANSLLKYARHSRNSSAHSNIMLINIFGYKNKIVERLTSEVRSIARDTGIKPSQISYLKIHDLACLFKLHQTYCSSEQNSVAMKKGIKLLERFDRNIDYYEKCPNIKNFKYNLHKLVYSLT